MKAIALVLVLLSGCCALTHTCANPVQGTLDCTVQKVGQDVAASVLAALESSDWESALGSLSVKYGADLIECAVVAALDLLQQKRMAATSPAEIAKLETAIMNAKAYRAKDKRTLKAK